MTKDIPTGLSSAPIPKKIKNEKYLEYMAENLLSFNFVSHCVLHVYRCAISLLLLTFNYK